MPPRKPVKWNPAEEGKTHLNMYSRSTKPAGQFASNFKNAPFIAMWEPNQPYFGSVEAYWYWLSVKRDGKPDVESGLRHLRSLSGYPAKIYGQKLLQTYGERHLPDFQQRIKEAITAKYKANEPQQKLLAQTIGLPLTHYYVFDAKKGQSQTVVDAGHEWMVEFMEELRLHYCEKFGIAVPTTHYQFPPDSEYTPLPPVGREFSGVLPGMAQLDKLLLVPANEPPKKGRRGSFGMMSPF